MRVFLLFLLPILSHALPQPQVTGDQIGERTANGQYDNEAPEVDDDLINELFGGHGAPLNQNYKPTQNVKVDSTHDDCAFYQEDGYSCVPYYQCDEFGTIITDGGPGLIDLRGNFGLEVELDPDNSKCKGDLEVCCRLQDYEFEPLKPKELPYTSKCGTRNIGGIGVRIQNDRYEANTQFGEFPHMCAILEVKEIGGSEKNLFVAGGSLIAPGIIMTAAHSVFNFSLPNYNNKLKVRCGEWDTQSTNEPAEHQDRYVETVMVHPGFSKTNVTNNIALLFMEEDFVLSAHVDIICLPNLSEMQDSYEKEGCFATGWGKDKFGNSGEYQTILKKIELDMVDPYQCQEALRTTRLGDHFNLDPTFACAGGEANKDVCQGDGGGPLICPNGQNNGYGPQYVQAGIVSWGIGCGEDGIPGVYTDVADMLCFIKWADSCQRGQTNYFQDITGCGAWAERELNRLSSIRDGYKYQVDNATDKRIKRAYQRRFKTHRLAAKRFQDAIAQCKYKPDNNIEDFDDYDEGLDLSGYQRIGNSLTRKAAILSGGESQEDDSSEEKS